MAVSPLVQVKGHKHFDVILMDNNICTKTEYFKQVMKFQGSEVQLRGLGNQFATKLSGIFSLSNVTSIPGKIGPI